MASERDDSTYDIAAKLGFDASDTVVAEAESAAKEMESDLEALGGEPQAKVQTKGTFSEDSLGALLDVYQTPRIEEESGPLTGLDVAIKDLIAVRELRITAGSKSLSFVPDFDATVVRRLLDNGATIVGKANLDAFAFGPTGEFSERRTVVNPVSTEIIPGGSSSGSAAAVAGDLVDASLGTDTGGSVRIPASCCGLVGVKPTHGLVSNFGVIPLAPSTDTVGPIAKDTETAAQLLEAIAGPDQRDPLTDGSPSLQVSQELGNIQQYRIGIPDAFMDPASDVVRDRISEVASTLDAQTSVSIETVNFSLGDVEKAYPFLISTEFAWMYRQGFQARGPGPLAGERWREALANVSLNDHIAKRVLPAAILDNHTSGRAYVAAREEIERLSKRFEQVFESYDLLLTPTLRVVPPKRGNITATEGNMDSIFGNTEPISLTGLPATSVPVGTIDDVPIGAQFIAPWFADERGLHAAKAVEECFESPEIS